MQWALESEILPGLRLAASLATYWWSRKIIDSNVSWFRRALQIEAEDLAGHPRPRERAWHRAEALRVAGHLAYYANTWERFGEEVALFEESLALYRAAGLAGRAGMANCLRNLGRSALDVPDYERAQALAEAGLALAREIERPVMIASGLVLLGRVTSARGEFGQARRLFEAAIAENEQVGNVVGIADCANWAAEAAFSDGDLDGAFALFQRAISMHAEVGDQNHLGKLPSRLGSIHLVRGRLAEAHEHFQAALAAGRKEHDPDTLALAIHGLGRLAAQQGHYSQAIVYLQEALTHRRQTSHDPNLIARLLDSLAEVAAAEHQAARAARLLGAADSLYARRPICLPALEKAARDATEAAARMLLGDLDFGRYRAEGRALRGREAIAYALCETDLPERLSTHPA
jgi:tetratricopeptide (TPR) repeat protein